MITKHPCCLKYLGMVVDVAGTVDSGGAFIYCNQCRRSFRGSFRMAILTSGGTFPIEWMKKLPPPEEVQDHDAKIEEDQPA